jgi:hypothetical protein
VIGVIWDGVAVLAGWQTRHPGVHRTIGSIMENAPAYFRAWPGDAEVAVALTFGQSMDYQVFLLSRIRERYVALILDATLVRMLLVPAVMRLVGDANRWATRTAAPLLRPAWLARRGRPRAARSRETRTWASQHLVTRAGGLGQ